MEKTPGGVLHNTGNTVKTQIKRTLGQRASILVSRSYRTKEPPFLGFRHLRPASKTMHSSLSKRRRRREVRSWPPRAYRLFASFPMLEAKMRSKGDAQVVMRPAGEVDFVSYVLRSQGCCGFLSLPSPLRSLWASLSNFVTSSCFDMTEAMPTSEALCARAFST
jgi:hypothetical protein